MQLHRLARLAPPHLLAGAWALSALLGAAPSPTSPSPQQNRLKNPGFERGGKEEVEAWVENVPLAEATMRPRFDTSTVEPTEGRRSASIRADFRGGFTAYSQSIRIIGKPRSLHLEADVRLDRVTHEGGAKLAVSFVGPDLPGGRVTVETRELTGIADWTRLSLDASIPTGAKTMEVRCGVVAPCVASFDDVVLTTSTQEARRVAFSSVSSDYSVRLPANARVELADPFVRVPLPLAMGGQRPAGLRVNTRPKEAVEALSFFRQGDNRLLEIRFKNMFPNEEIKFRVETLVMVEEQAPPEPGLIRLGRPSQIKEGLELFLQPAPGIDPKDAAVQELILEIRGNELPGVLEEVSKAVKGRLKPRVPDPEDLDPVYDDSVAGCLAAGTAGPMGFANAAASLLRALGIPSRLVQATREQDAHDERYFVDVWCPSLQWTRLDPMTGEWPLPRMAAIVHRLVTPDDLRSEESVPYDPKVASPGLILEARPDRMERARLYRRAVPVVLLEEGLSLVAQVVEASYGELVRDPIAADQWLPIEGLGEVADELPGAAAAHIAVQAWLDRPRLVGQ